MPCVILNFPYSCSRASAENGSRACGIPMRCQSPGYVAMSIFKGIRKGKGMAFPLATV